VKKVRKTFLATLVLLLIAAAAYAETNWRPVVYAGGGASIPTSKFHNEFKTGFNFGGGAGVIYKSMFEFTGNVNYSRFPLDQTKFLANFTGGSSVSGGAAKVLNYGAEVKYLIPAGGNQMRLHPYILGRIGAAHLTQADVTVNTSEGSSTNSFSSLNKLTYGGGIGTTIDVNPNLGLWVEGRFTGINTPVNKTDYIPIQAGIRYVFGKE
jgi:opacity protein-like surface antigen